MAAAASRVQARLAARLAPRRLLSSGGKVLGEEEKAAENVYIKGPSPGEQGSFTPGADLKAEAGPTAGVSTDKNKNYAVIAGAIGVAGVIAWYLLPKPKKSEEVAN
uniref:Uncharacterized protein n=1 Tax=Leersia perrieri TaxID=77586 RepID=A0A0D9XAV6_9ORYZ